MSTVLRRGAPSRSYPSRQPKLGPAPFASFEDLSDELESPADGAHHSGRSVVDPLPEIKEDYGPSCSSPRDERQLEEDDNEQGHKVVSATMSSGSTTTYGHSQPTSGLQTPSTPRIDISCASSSTPPSEDSASEKELFQGGLGYAFHEEGTEELRSSTEELELGDEGMDSDEERRQKKREREGSEDFYRRSSHPANIFSRRKSSNDRRDRDRDEHDLLNRKPSTHTLFLEGLLSRPSPRHASFGSADYNRPGAISSLSAHSSGSIRGRAGSRSPSPHRMMLETSFCGSKPIPTKSMEMESPPKEPEAGMAEQGQMDYVATTTRTTTTPPATTTAATATTTTNGSSSLPFVPNRSLSIKSLTARPTALTEPCSPSGRSTRSPSLGKSPLTPRSPRSPHGDSRRPSSGRRSVSPFNMLMETSFCGSKPIPTKSMEQESPPKEKNEMDLFLSTSQVQVHQAPSHTPSSPKSSDHWRPVTPKSELEACSPSPGHSINCNTQSRSRTPTPSPGVADSESSPSISQSTAKYISTPNPAQNLKLQTTNIFKWPDSDGNEAASSSTKGVIPPPLPKRPSETEDNRDSKSTEVRLKKKEEASSLPLKDSHGPGGTEEINFLHQSFDDDEDFPFVPTTLPQEKPSAGLFFPSKERRRSGSLQSDNIPLERPKVRKCPNPASINDYIAHSSKAYEGIGEDSKMKINLPREDSRGGTSSAFAYQSVSPAAVQAQPQPTHRNSPKKGRGSIGATNWDDFAEMGLRSPRDIRKKLKEDNGDSQD